MGAIGNLNDYVKYQMGQSMTMGGEASAATTSAQMGMGFAMAQEMTRNMQQQQAGVAAPAASAPASGGLEVLTPEQAAQSLGVSVEDVMASITAGELKARKIGSAYRIAKSALEEFLKGA